MKTITVDKENATASIKFSLQKIKLNKEPKKFYYDKDAEQWLIDEGFKPLRCIKSCTVENVKHTSGEWVFEIELPKPKPKRKRRSPQTRRSERLNVPSPTVDEETVEIDSFPQTTTLTME